jgi:O-antigen ligase/tetratricopeptide (TPR) repeat protein
MAGVVVATTLAAGFAVLVGGFGEAGIRVAFDVGAALALVTWLSYGAFHERWRPASRLMPAIAACLAAFAIATMTSRSPRLSVEMLAYAVLLVELYLLLVALMRRPRLRTHFGRLALVLCLAVGVLYLVQVIGAWRDWWALLGRLAVPPLRPAYVGLTLGSPNPLAALVLLLAAFALFTIGISSRRGLVASAILVPVTGVVVLLTGSRGAWLGAAMAMIATAAAALAFIPGARHWTARLVVSRRGKVLLLTSFLGLAAAVVLAARGGRLNLDDESRGVFAAASQQMFAASPLTGLGPGTWPALRAGNTAAGHIDVYVPHAHSVYWQALAEFGLIGVVAGLIGVVSIGLLVVRALRSHDAPRQRVALAAVFTVVLLAVHQTIDMFMNVPAVLLAMALPIAWLDAVEPDGETAGRRTIPPPRAFRAAFNRLAPLAMAAITCLVVTGLVRVEAATDIETKAVAAADSGDWAEAARLAQQAADADPDLAGYQFTLGVTAANANNLPLAEASLTRSATFDDYTVAWLDLAAGRWRMGLPDGARTALSRAERLGVQRPAVALPAGWLRQQLGDTQAAITDYVAALGGAPTLSADPFWSSTGARQVWPAVWDAAQSSFDAGTLLKVDLAAGRPDLAKPVAATLAQADPSLYSLVVPAWQGDAAAWTALQALASARPNDADVVSWAALVAGHRGDQAGIDRYRRWAVINDSPAALPPFAHITDALTQTEVPSVFDDYGLLYRRPVPADQIIDILPQLTWQDQP